MCSTLGLAAGIGFSSDCKQVIKPYLSDERTFKNNKANEAIEIFKFTF